MPTFELQGHRGARGLKPENTLPSFEVAFDIGVTSIETDVHLTRDGVPVLYHDAAVTRALCGRTLGSTSAHPTNAGVFINAMKLRTMRGYRADRNPNRRRFPTQDRVVTPLADWFAQRYKLDPFTPPTLKDLFRLTKAYIGKPGRVLCKTDDRRESCCRLILDLELKRVPYHPEYIGDEFDGEAPGLLEQTVVEAVRKAGMVGRTRVRSFDHRAVRAVRHLEPGLSAAVLIAGTAPVHPAALARSAGADTYCPDYRFLDAAQVCACHAAGVRVLPWTVNEEADWLRLLDWGVDGITTDYPDQLALVLRERNIPF